MASFLTVAERNAMLDSRTYNATRLHSGVPGESGTDNALGSGTEATTFSAASDAGRAVATDVPFTGLGASATVTHFSAWDGSTFRGWGEIESGDTTANAAGEFVLKAGTEIRIDNPA